MNLYVVYVVVSYVLFIHLFSVLVWFKLIVITLSFSCMLYESNYMQKNVEE